jgi:hypothetical protein
VVFMASIEKDADREFFSPLGNGRRFRLTEWMTRLLDPGRSEQMDRWAAMQPKQRAFSRVDPEPQADADALWEYCKQVAERAALDSLGRSEGARGNSSGSCRVP